MSDLTDAIDRIAARKAAVLDDLTVKQAREAMGNGDYGRRLLLGTDLDVEEAATVGLGIGTACMAGMVAAVNAGITELYLSGIWIDGLVHGLAVADLRREREVAEAGKTARRERLDALAAAERIGAERERERILAELRNAAEGDNQHDRWAHGWAAAAAHIERLAASR